MPRTETAKARAWGEEAERKGESGESYVRGRKGKGGQGYGVRVVLIRGFRERVCLAEREPTKSICPPAASTAKAMLAPTTSTPS